MRSGRLDRRAAIQRRNVTADAEGNELENWTDVGMAWLALEPAANAEIETAGQQEQRRFWTVTTRYRRDVDHNCRFVLQPSGRVLDILTVLDTADGRGESHRALEIAVGCGSAGGTVGLRLGRATGCSRWQREAGACAGST